MMIMIPIRVRIVKTFIIDAYEISTIDVLLKMNLIVLALCDFNVRMNWLFFSGLVKIVMFWKLKIFFGLSRFKISIV